jgi:hypothetical protein
VDKAEESEEFEELFFVALLEDFFLDLLPYLRERLSLFEDFSFE